MISGKITNVIEEVMGSELVADVAGGALSGLVQNIDDFDLDDGGDIRFADNGEVVGYDVVDEATGEIAFRTPLAGGHVAGVRVELEPPVKERYALFQEEGDSGGEQWARVPIGLKDRLPLDMRTPETAETLEAEWKGERLVLYDVPHQDPEQTAEFIQPDTFVAPPSDGAAPPSSPTPTTLGGPTFISLRWDPVVNADPVTYEVHVSATNGFLPGAGTLYAELRGTGIIVKSLVGGTPFVYGTTYYFRLIAKDQDGSALAGVQASGQMAQVNSPDIAANAITATQIAADAVTAAKIDVSDLSAISADLGAITAGTVTGGTVRTALTNPKVQMDSTGLFVTDASGNKDALLDTTGLRFLEGVDAWPSIPDTRVLRWVNGVNDVGTLYAYLSGLARITRLESIGRSSLGDFSAIAEIGARRVGEGTGAGVNVSLVRDVSGSGSNQVLVTLPSGVQRILLSDGLVSDWALTGVLNTFTKRQVMQPDTDTASLDLKRGTDIAPAAALQRWMTGSGSLLASITSQGYGNFQQGIGTQVAAGVVTDANYGAQAASGSLGLDTTNKRLYARVGANWNFIPISTVAPPNYITNAYTVRRNLPASATVTLAQVADVLATLLDDFGASGAGNGLLS